jgi:hypothetical protein
LNDKRKLHSRKTRKMLYKYLFMINDGKTADIHEFNLDVNNTGGSYAH